MINRERFRARRPGGARHPASLERKGKLSNVTNVGANAEIANSVHYALAGQGMVDSAGGSEAHVIDSLFRHQAIALIVQGLGSP